MSKNSYVYILVDKSQQKFKIGLTIDILQRYKTLASIYGKFSLRNSYLIECKESYGKKLEKILHFTFSDFNLNINSNLGGHTEWFDISCLNDLISFIKKIKHLNKNIIKIKQDIQELEILNKNSLDKNKAIRNKKEHIIKQIKKENLLNTIIFLKTIKKLIKNKRLYKKDSFVLIFENFTLSESKEFADKLFLVLHYETLKLSGGFGITDAAYLSENRLYIDINFNSLNKYKNLEQIKRPYILLKNFFAKHLNININEKIYL